MALQVSFMLNRTKAKAVATARKRTLHTAVRREVMQSPAAQLSSADALRRTTRRIKTPAGGGGGGSHRSDTVLIAIIGQPQLLGRPKMMD